MALDPKKRQKKLAKRKAQRKDKAKKIIQQQQRKQEYEANRIALAARYPLHQCLAPVEIFAGGMGTVIVSRSAPNGDIVMSTFLLDTFCLGVKNAFARFLTLFEYEELVREIRYNELLQTVEPSYARKIVESAVEYAAGLGFKPNPDYHTAKDLFGDIDASECTDQFTFGKDGKPFYIAGPHDSPMKRKQILATLEKNCGVGNFDILAPGGMGFGFDDDEFELLDAEDFDEDYDEEEDDDEFERLMPKPE